MSSESTGRHRAPASIARDCLIAAGGAVLFLTALVVLFLEAVFILCLPFSAIIVRMYLETR
jgi:hypothetical protein